MGFFTAEPGTDDSVPEPDGVKAYPQEYRNSIVQSRYVNQTSLLTNVTGTPVVVDYYRQHQGSSEEQLGFQLNDISTYQSYQRINRLIIKFDGRPTYSYDGESDISTEDGNAYFIADVAPLLGDMFVRDVGDGRAGLYQITVQPELRSYAMDKVYYVTFKLLGFVTAAIQANLDAKVVKEYYYSKDSALSGGNALLTEENYAITKSLIGMIPVLVRKLFQVGYFNPEETIVINEPSGVLVYDADLLRFLAAVVPLECVPAGSQIKLINTQVGANYQYDAPLTVWDALLSQNADILLTAATTQYRYGRKQFFTTRYYGGPNFTKINFFLTSQQLSYNGQGFNPLFGTATSLFPKTEPVSKPPTYFSTGFYLGNPSSDFEKLVYDFFFNNIRDYTALLAYAKTVLTLADRDVIYQSGVIIMMLELSRRKFIGD